MNSTSNIAIYIDGDNANYKDFNYVYEEIKSRKSPILIITTIKNHQFKNYINITENKQYQEILSIE